MGRRPSFQFYPSDWRTDPALRMCSLAARGLWWEMCCVMHTCEPYGHLTAAGKAVEAEELARIVGESAKDVRRWLGELERHRIFSRTDDGIIYSRRMVRDEQERDNWRDRQGKSRAKAKDVTPHVTPHVTQESRRSSSSSSSSSSSPSVRERATRWDADRCVSEDWLQAAGMKRAELGLPEIDLRYEAERFKNYWAGKSGQNATKVDWRLTWMNWATDKEKTGNGHGGQQRKSTSHDRFLAAGAKLIAELDESSR